MAGILGRLFREFAVTICTAILISGMVSISLTPMLCSRFLREAQAREARLLLPRHGRDLRPHAASSTPSTLGWVLRHRPVMLAMFLAVLGVTVYLYMVVPKGFIPDTDNDNFNDATWRPRRALRTTRW